LNRTLPSADQGMSADQLRWVRGVKMKNRLEGGAPQSLAHHAKSLHEHPYIRVQLTRRHIERLKDAHRERVERKRHVQVRKRTTIHEEKGGFGR